MHARRNTHTHTHMFFFIVVKVCVGLATCFGWAGKRRMVHHCATYFPCSIPQVLNSESFFSLDWLKSPVCPTKTWIRFFSPLQTIGGLEMDSCLFQGHYHELKCKQPHPGFEVGYIYIYMGAKWGNQSDSMWRNVEQTRNITMDGNLVINDEHFWFIKKPSSGQY